MNMKMLKLLYKGVAMAVVLGIVTACTTEIFPDDAKPDYSRIEFVGQVEDGMLTRGTVATSGPLANYQNLYLSAKLTDGTTDYFKNISLNVSNPNNAAPNPTSNLLSADAYYPLGQTTIGLLAHTGQQAANGTLSLTSGKAITNDVLISNGPDGKGTVGHSKDPVELLTFRHVMTKVEVKIDISVDEDMQPDKPTDISIGFGNLVANTGRYALTTDPGNVTANIATNTSGQYTLDVGTHFLVPNGSTLSGDNKITSLVIDDYTATAADLAALTIPQAETEAGVKSDLILRPGLSYTLTFQIKRLKLVGIKLTLNPWDLSEGSSGWDYDPYKVSLGITGEDAGAGYDKSKITKVVLKHKIGETTYQYIGERKDDGNIAFVTLPPGLGTDAFTSGLTADLYIEEGLLINDIDVTTEAGKKELKITLGQHGLKKSDDDYYEITTPLQLALTMSDPAAVKYRLTRDIDMDNNPIPFNPVAFPSGALLDGNKFKILHLQMEDASGLVPVNNGILRNIHIASGTIKGNGAYMGGISGTNNGVIEGCINEANIETANTNATVGGISGLNDTNGTILASLNTGNALKGKIVGGIVGENKNTLAGAIKACLNIGLLNRETATTLGGICGTSAVSGTTKVIDTCYWLTGTARKIQSTSDEVTIGHVATGTVANATQTVSDLAGGAIRSIDIINKLSVAAGDSWKFEMNISISSWPIPVPVP